MGLLEIDHATKGFANGQRETVVLREVSLDVGAGELVVVRGTRRSGRSTLLRVAAGMLAPDAGEVRFDREPLARRAHTLGVEIGWCNPGFDPAQAGTVADHVAVALLARGAGRMRARAQADAALARVGASGCANLEPRELRADELVRAGIARALVTRPRLLLLDEPSAGATGRDALPALLRSLAEEGVALLMTAGEPVPDADRRLVLEGGRLRDEAATPEAPGATSVVPLRPWHVEPVA